MALAPRCVSEFPAKIRHRGDDYADLGLVQIEDRLEQGVRAEVLGSQKRVYRVGVGWDPIASNLTVSCTCPSFDQGPCKHIWATLKTIDAEHPDLVPGVRPLRVMVASPSASAPAEQDHVAPAPPPAWRQALSAVDSEQTRIEATPDEVVSHELFFTIDTKASERQKRLVILFQQRRAKPGGGLTQPRPFELTRSVRGVEPPALRRTLLQLIGSGPPGGDPSTERITACEVVEPEALASALDSLCATERFYRVDAAGREHVLAWDGDRPWRVHLIIEPQDGAERTWRLRGELKRGSARRPVDEPDAVLTCGVLLFLNRLALLAPGDVPWVMMLRQEGVLTIPPGEEAGLLDALWAMPNTPPITYPPELTWEQREDPPTPRLSLWPTFARGKEVLAGRVGFVYGEQELQRGERRRGVVDGRQRYILQRRPDSESQRWAEALDVGLRERGAEEVLSQEGDLELTPDRLPDVVEKLLASGWQVVADGVPYRAPGEVHLEVESGIDWFDLKGGADFEGREVSLPTLLEAVQKEQRFVDLPDGSRGALPQQWINRLQTFASLGQRVGDAMRFENAQATLLDALLEAEQQVLTDEQFNELRQRLRASSHPEPQDPPSSFLGSLRSYQQEALGWMHHLRGLGLSGCLADDMGLGKTVQCLALMAQRHQDLPASERRPHLVVMPRSLIFNWRQEAARFTPHLRVTEFTGAGRSLIDLINSDIALTTYGVLRRDIHELREVELDYVILDEAQAVKNDNSDVSKAARLLRSRYRLAVTGTPVENRLSELGSLMTFLNPGLFGARAHTRELFKNDASAELIATGVRPLILRRTKEQVLDELPPKTELTMFCEMSERQSELYDELRDHYRGVLTQCVDDVGINRAKMQVLEALLRLRQAACHPALVDPSFDDVPSGKLELLFEQIESVVAEGHKGLIFSQFTSLLGIVRNQLDERGIRYAYLDGQTRDRQGKVAEFQNDPNCSMFLISLKAGGYGLNLIAASYVFILDPWWNPAVEAQAVDRAYRMGQKQRVFAYRLVSKGTVEEKILALQEHKRRIAEAIVSQENSVLQNLTPEDLELLLA